MLILGIDPGAKGALALLDTDTMRLVKIWDMPTFNEKVGGKDRPQVDPVELDLIFEEINRLDGLIVSVLERVKDQGPLFVFNPKTHKSERKVRTGQMQLGASWGIVRGLIQAHKFVYEAPEPSVWKRALKVPADKTDAVARADELFPYDQKLFRGPKGGLKDGAGEAALLALYGYRIRGTDVIVAPAVPAEVAEFKEPRKRAKRAKTQEIVAEEEEICVED